MPQVDQVSRRPSKRVSIAVGAAAFVVVLFVVAGVLMWGVWSPQPKSTGTGLTTAAVLDKASALDFAGKGDEAMTLLQNQLSQTKDQGEQQQLYMAIGSKYEVKGDFKKALENYRKGAAIKAGYGTNASIARAAEADHNTALALDYYKRNLELIKSGKAFQYAGDQPDVEDAIKRLGGTL